MFVDVWDTATGTTVVSIFSVHPKSFSSLSQDSLSQFASYINYNLHIGCFDVYPFTGGEIKFVVCAQCPRTLFSDPEHHPALFAALKRSVEHNAATMSRCFDTLSSYADGRLTAKQAAELPFTGGLGAAAPPSGGPPGAAVPDGVQEVLAAIANACLWDLALPGLLWKWLSWMICPARLT